MKITKKITTALFALSFINPTISFANSVGNAFQNFNPTYSGLDFITVHSSETLEPCILNAGLYYNQAYNSLPFFESVDFNIDDFRNRTNYNDTVGGIDFNLGFGITKNWDIGLNIQSFVQQKIKSDSLISGSFERGGLSEVRLNTKYRFTGDHQGGFALVGSVNINTIENNIFLGKGAGPTFNLEAVYDKTFKNINWALNLGYRLRQEGEVLKEGVIPFGDAFIYSTALSYLFKGTDFKLIGELFGSTPTENKGGLNKKAQSHLEALLGFKYDYTEAHSFVGGLSSEVISGTASPDWRFFVGFNWSLDCCGDEPTVEPTQPVSFPQVAEAVEENIDPPEPTEIFIAYNINFKSGSSTRTYKNSLDVLKKVARYAKEKNYQKIIVVGHTDSIGSDSSNMELSYKRSKNIARHLIKKYNLDPEKVTHEHHGERQPIADNGNFQGRRKNRRVEFLLYY